MPRPLEEVRISVLLALNIKINGFSFLTKIGVFHKSVCSNILRLAVDCFSFYPLTSCFFAFSNIKIIYEYRWNGMGEVNNRKHNVVEKSGMQKMRIFNFGRKKLSRVQNYLRFFDFVIFNISRRKLSRKWPKNAKFANLFRQSV